MLNLELYHPYVGIARIRLRGYHLSRQQTAPLDNSGAKVQQKKEKCKLFAKFLYCLIIGVETADVETTCRHPPCMHRGVVDHIVGEITWGILTTTVLYGVTYQVEVFLHIYINKVALPNGSSAPVVSLPCSAPSSARGYSHENARHPQKCTGHFKTGVVTPTTPVPSALYLSGFEPPDGRRGGVFSIILKIL